MTVIDRSRVVFGADQLCYFTVVTGVVELHMASPKENSPRVDSRVESRKEVRLSRVFGEEPTPTKWLAFKSLVQKLNVLNGISKWDDKRYCAMMIRLQLLGEPEIWLRLQASHG